MDAYEYCIQKLMTTSNPPIIDRNTFPSLEKASDLTNLYQNASMLNPNYSGFLGLYFFQFGTPFALNDTNSALLIVDSLQMTTGI